MLAARGASILMPIALLKTLNRRRLTGAVGPLGTDSEQACVCGVGGNQLGMQLRVM